MRLNDLLVLVLSSMLIFPGLARACSAPEMLVFSCTTTKQKYVEVCDAGKTISYVFGRKGGKPELSLSIPREEATTYQWKGFGRYITYSVNIPNGSTVYSVFSGLDRLAEDHPLEAGINVMSDGAHIATIACRSETVENNMEGIDLRQED